MIFTGTDNGDNYTATVSEVKNNSIKGDYVDVVFEIDGDEDILTYSGGDSAKWVEDHTGTQDSNLIAYLSTVIK